MLGSECNLKMHVQNMGHPLALKIGDPRKVGCPSQKIGSQNTFTFVQFVNDFQDLMANVFRTKHV